MSSFKFGYDIILRDISKITLLKKNLLKNILQQIEFTETLSEDELIERENFEPKVILKS